MKWAGGSECKPEKLAGLYQPVKWQGPSRGSILVKLVGKLVPQF